MRITILTVLLLVFQTCSPQIKVMRLSKSAIPRGIQYTGNVMDAVRWTDSLGNHMVIVTETGETSSKGMESDDYRDAALFAYHYLGQQDSMKLTWKLNDYVKECPVDIKAHFIKNTFAITDLDKDGKAEVWLMYKLACRGDVSSADMKIVMYEDNKKYAVRGTNKVQLSEKEFAGGQYRFDDAFKKGPDVFKQYAMRLWEKNIMETWE